jgi:DnaK suppressor protein
VTIDLERRKAELVALRERLVATAEGIVPDEEDSGEINTAAGDQHIADHASDMLERELDWTLEENAEHILKEIDSALARIDEGTYGTCVVCGGAARRAALRHALRQGQAPRGALVSRRAPAADA